MREVLLQIAGFVIGAGVLGLLTGWLVGRASVRAARRAASQAEAAWVARGPDVVVQERVLVRPDPSLYAENERLRDRLVVLQARAAALTSQVAELEARAAAAARRPGGAAADEPGELEHVERDHPERDHPEHAGHLDHDGTVPALSLVTDDPDGRERG